MILPKSFLKLISSFRINNTFVMFGGHVFQQTVGITIDIATDRTSIGDSNTKITLSLPIAKRRSTRTIFMSRGQCYQTEYTQFHYKSHFVPLPDTNNKSSTHEENPHIESRDQDLRTFEISLRNCDYARDVSSKYTTLETHN